MDNTEWLKENSYQLEALRNEKFKKSFNLIDELWNWGQTLKIDENLPKEIEWKQDEVEDFVFEGESGEEDMY